MAEKSPLNPLGLTVNPATGPETLGIAYDYDTKLLHRLENAQIYSFFEKITEYCTITVSHKMTLGIFFSPQYEFLIEIKSTHLLELSNSDPKHQSYSMNHKQSSVVYLS